MRRNTLMSKKTNDVIIREQDTLLKTDRAKRQSLSPIKKGGMRTLLHDGEFKNQAYKYKQPAPRPKDQMTKLFKNGMGSVDKRYASVGRNYESSINAIRQDVSYRGNNPKQTTGVKQVHISLGAAQAPSGASPRPHMRRVDVVAENPSYLKNYQEKQQNVTGFIPDTTRRHYPDRDRDFHVANSKELIYQRNVE